MEKKLQKERQAEQTEFSSDRKGQTNTQTDSWSEVKTPNHLDSTESIIRETDTHRRIDAQTEEKANTH